MEVPIETKKGKQINIQEMAKTLAELVFYEWAKKKENLPGNLVRAGKNVETGVEAENVKATEKSKIGQQQQQEAASSAKKTQKQKTKMPTKKTEG
jgi:hypothetical protein